MNSPLISVIIPVYMVENYLKACVDSVLAQTFSSCEVILVDDGSPDGCPGICDSYAAADVRVKVVHKGNGGLSDARNAGIKVSKGKYLLFIDGDDFIEKDCLSGIEEKLEAEDVDIAFLDAVNLFPDGKITPYGKLSAGKLSGKGAAAYLASIPQFHVSACIKLVRKDLIINKKIFFEKGIFGEDVDWSIKLYLCAERFAYWPITYYYYRQRRKGSITAGNLKKRYSDLIFIIEKWLCLADNEFMSDAKTIYSFLYHQYYMLISMYANLGKEDRKRYKRQLLSWAWLLSYSESSNWKMTVFYKVFGIRILSAAINAYGKVVSKHG